MPIMLTQVVAMFIMMMIGAALYKAKLVDNTGSAQIASVALYVATPAVTSSLPSTTQRRACSLSACLNWDLSERPW